MNAQIYSSVRVFLFFFSLSTPPWARPRSYPADSTITHACTHTREETSHQNDHPPVKPHHPLLTYTNVNSLILVLFTNQKLVQASKRNLEMRAKGAAYPLRRSIPACKNTATIISSWKKTYPPPATTHLLFLLLALGNLHFRLMTTHSPLFTHPLWPAFNK